MSRKFYLAYGSNLNVEQMKQRCPGAVMIGMTWLEDYRITFRGNPRFGVANIEPRKGSRVPVGIWSITQGDERSLDRYEGYPSLYDKHEFREKLPDLRTVSAIAYIMTPGRRWAAPPPHAVVLHHRCSGSTHRVNPSASPGAVAALQYVDHCLPPCGGTDKEQPRNLSQ